MIKRNATSSRIASAPKETKFGTEVPLSRNVTPSVIDVGVELLAITADGVPVKFRVNMIKEHNHRFESGVGRVISIDGTATEPGRQIEIKLTRKNGRDMISFSVSSTAAANGGVPWASDPKSGRVAVILY